MSDNRFSSVSADAVFGSQGQQSLQSRRRCQRRESLQRIVNGLHETGKKIESETHDEDLNFKSLIDPKSRETQSAHRVILYGER